MRSSGRLNGSEKLFWSAGWRMKKADAFNPRYEVFEHRNPLFGHLGLDGDNACDVIVMTRKARVCHIHKNNRNS